MTAGVNPYLAHFLHDFCLSPVASEQMSGFLPRDDRELVLGREVSSLLFPCFLRACTFSIIFNLWFLGRNFVQLCVQVSVCITSEIIQSCKRILEGADNHTEQASGGEAPL